MSRQGESMYDVSRSPRPNLRSIHPFDAWEREAAGVTIPKPGQRVNWWGISAIGCCLVSAAIMGLVIWSLWGLWR